MATGSFSLLSVLSLLALQATLVQPKPLLTSPYLSPETVLFPDYQKMVNNFRIYIYNPPNPFNFTTPSESLFYDSLVNSHFVTQNPNEAHLFLVPFPPELSTRSLSRFVRDLRVNFPYWNRTLGADHFFLSRDGIKLAADRNVLELKKNSVQISCFPTTFGNFIPHKDITLPPLYQPSASPLTLSHSPINGSAKMFLGLLKLDERSESSLLIKELEAHSEFLIESEPSDLAESIGNSKFCLFEYGGDASWMGEALRSGCLPVVITDRPIQDLPLMDALRWSDIAVFVGKKGGVTALKGFLARMEGERYKLMTGLGVTAGQHFVWNAPPQPLDAFHMVMYQLWLRRHTIRYARRDWV